LIGKLKLHLFEYTKALTIETLLWGFSVEGAPITGKKKAQTNVVWADTSIGVNKENAVIKKAGRTTSLTAC